MHEAYRPDRALPRSVTGAVPLGSSASLSSRPTDAPPRRPPGRRRAAVPLAALVLSAASACGGDSAGPSPEAPIERETFIAAYVDLRAAALRTDSQRIAEADRDEILDRHGVTRQELLDFVEANAGRLEFMRDLWSDVEVQLEGRTADGEVR